MIDTGIRWPAGARVAVMLTFDFDAKTFWLSRDPENARRPGVLSQGRQGIRATSTRQDDLQRQQPNGDGSAYPAAVRRGAAEAGAAPCD